MKLTVHQAKMARRSLPSSVFLLLAAPVVGSGGGLHAPATHAQAAPVPPATDSRPAMPGTPFAKITGMKCVGTEHNHIIYLMDTSGSMRDGNKYLKLMRATKTALLELRPSDTVNIISFDVAGHAFAERMLSATPENIAKASAFIDILKLRPYTNMSDALEQALADPTVTHIFLMSDGEPNTGISEFPALRKFVKAHNRHKTHINTVALGLGERFPGVRLMKELAEENDGQYAYVNLDDKRPPNSKE